MLSYLIDIIFPIFSFAMIGYILFNDIVNDIYKHDENTTIENNETNDKIDECKSEIQELKGIIDNQNDYISELYTSIRYNNKCLTNIKKTIEDQLELLSMLRDKLINEEEETSDSYITVD